MFSITVKCVWLCGWSNDCVVGLMTVLLYFQSGISFDLITNKIDVLLPYTSWQYLHTYMAIHFKRGFHVGHMHNNYANTHTQTHTNTHTHTRTHTHAHTHHLLSLTFTCFPSLPPPPPPPPFLPQSHTVRPLSPDCQGAQSTNLWLASIIRPNHDHHCLKRQHS